jgi:hypothetical protein
MNFSTKDFQQIQNHGLKPEIIQQQIKDFESGFPFIDIVKPAVQGDGVIQYTNEDIEKFISIYDKYATSHKTVKFVPASGAATRMFKDLFDFMSNDIENQTVLNTVNNIDKFAFWNKLKTYLPENYTSTDIVKNLLTDSGLNYGNQPKGLIIFHKYANGVKTAVEEHLVEGAKYAKSGDTVYIHFTISPEHRAGFEGLLKSVLLIYESEFNVKYNITMSEQKKSTDTIAVNMDNTPFRNEDGSLLFRPAGHGALIENLNDIDADLIFIKNIDNVTNDDLINDTIKYKKALAGTLIKLQSEIFELLKNNDANKMHDFITNQIGIKLNQKLSLDEYKNILNRPLRVCGVVKNTGEPGGGPFWVCDKNGNVSLQIVESSQIAPESKDIMKQSEYFNPVDLVCATKDMNGNKFDLNKYIDKDTGFISEKSKNGKPLRAMERPGLWNGAMANWNTVFVAVPITTFNPVKIVTDLLKPAHQPISL